MLILTHKLHIMKKLILTFLLIRTSILFAQTNLITNAGFETFAAGTSSYLTNTVGSATNFPNQWQLSLITNCSGSCAAGQSTIVTNTKNTGNNALYLIINKQANRNDIRLLQSFDSPQQGIYALSFYLKSDKAGYPVTVDVLKPTQAITTNGNVPYSFQISTTTTWTQYKMYVDLTTWTSNELKSMRISIRPNTVLTVARPSGPFPKEFWIDDVSFYLTNRGTAESLKQAAIAVATTRQLASQNAGFTTEANTLTTEIATLNSSPATNPVQPTFAYGFYPVPTQTTAETNPFIKSIQEWATNYLATPMPTYRKSMVGVPLFITSEASIEPLGIALEKLHWLLVSPYSDYQYNPELFKRFLNITYATTDDYELNGTEGIEGQIPGKTVNALNNWLHAPSIAYGWRMADYSFANYIPATLKNTLKVAATSMGTQHKAWAANINNEVYVNRDISYAETLMHTGLQLNNTTWQDTSKQIVDIVTNSTNLSPDGAFTYYKSQNEVTNYHGANNNSLAKIWTVSNYEPAKTALTKASNYELISIEGTGVGEFYTAAAWKSQWNGFSGYSEEPLLYFSRNTALKSKMNLIRKAYGWTPLALNISFYDPTIGESPLKDNYIVYDSNIKGPRGRNGRFSYAATLRNVSPASTDVGLQTIIGAMTTKAGRNPDIDELDAAVMAIHSKVHVKKSTTPTEWIDCGYLNTNIDPKLCMSKTAATVSTKSDLQSQNYGPVAAITQWSSYQQWITLPDRIIGIVETFPTKNQATKAFEIDGRVKFTYGRSGLLAKKNIVTEITNKQYSYGKLRAIIHDHDFTTVSTALGGIIRDDQSPNPSTEIIFRYNLSDGSTLYSYPGTTKKYFIIEIRNTDVTTNATVSRVNAGNLKGLIVTIDGKKFSSYRNMGSTPTNVDLTNAKVAGYTTKGFLSRTDTDTKAPLDITTSSITLAANEQVLVISSNDTNDLTNGWASFNALMANTASRTSIETTDLENILFHQDKAYLYPNPTNGNTINLKAYLEQDTNVVLDIYDIQGRTVLSKNLETQKQGELNQELNISSLNQGTYILKINYDNQKTETIRFIKTN